MPRSPKNVIVVLFHTVSCLISCTWTLQNAGISRSPRRDIYSMHSEAFKARIAKGLPHPKVYRCGDLGKDLVVNFVNQLYPENDNGGGECRFRLVVTSPHICQIRVDFVDTELMMPIRGECLSQHFEVEGAVWPTGLPPLCGINNDQHFYLHLEPWSENSSVVDFKVVTVVRGRPYRFGVWLTQIDCSTFNVLKAPEGCTQYYLGETGMIKSFNYEGYRYPNGLSYQICIRPGKGVCGIRYEASDGDFSMKKSVSGSKEVQLRSGNGADVCGTDYIMIPEGRESILNIRHARLLFRRRRPAAARPVVTAATTPLTKRKKPVVDGSSDRYCGSYLSPTGGENANKPVFARVRSNMIALRVRTSPLQEALGVTPNLTTGFRLSYSQIRDCQESEIDMVSQPSITNLLNNVLGGFSSPLLRDELERDKEPLEGADSMDMETLDIAGGSKKGNTSEVSDDDKLWDYLDDQMDDGEIEEDDLYDF